jgi:hypothetical protein
MGSKLAGYGVKLAGYGYPHIAPTAIKNPSSMIDLYISI